MSEPRSVSDLMLEDPLNLTKEDRAPIIEYYRQKRTLFLSTGAKAMREPKAKPKASAGLDLTLDLGVLK